MMDIVFLVELPAVAFINTVPAPWQASPRAIQLKNILVAIALLFLPSLTLALETDADQPINIRARNVELNEKTGVAVYRGNVVLAQGSMNLHAEHLEVTRKNGQIDNVRATGKPATLGLRTDGGETLTASAHRVEYRVQTRTLKLRDNVTLTRAGDVFTGAMVQYLLDEETLTAEGGAGGQTYAVIQPPPTLAP